MARLIDLRTYQTRERVWVNPDHVAMIEDTHVTAKETDDDGNVIDIPTCVLTLALPGVYQQAGAVAVQEPPTLHVRNRASVVAARLMGED
jgi:hypothetical protein